jgi:thiol-disulfide isomerase/thioredoxin
MRFFLAFTMATLLLACAKKEQDDVKIRPGVWRGVISIQGKALPFNFIVEDDSTGKTKLFIKNADETLEIDEVKFSNDSIIATLHIFDSELKAKIDGDSLSGFFIKNYEKDYRLPFRAAYGQGFRFTNKIMETNIPDFTGKYAVTFINERDTTVAVGIFTQKENHAEGTFLTPEGDYRYLEGNIINDTLHLSTFDGNHTYLFIAVKNKDGNLTGDYWSGKSWHESWTGVRDESAALPDSKTLTYLKEGFDKIEFRFPDEKGKMITSADPKYKNKVLILQLMGTWCPNCMDETKFLTEWYAKNKHRNIEIIALAYEAKPDFAYASSRVKKMKEKLGVPYEVVIAGTKNKEEASKTLPMLNKISAFPTTIIVGKDGFVKEIDTGFSGPGTGIYYDRYKQHFNELISDLLLQNVK